MSSRNGLSGSSLKFDPPREGATTASNGVWSRELSPESLPVFKLWAAWPKLSVCGRKYRNGHLARVVLLLHQKRRDPLESGPQLDRRMLVTTGVDVSLRENLTLNVAF